LYRVRGGIDREMFGFWMVTVGGASILRGDASFVPPGLLWGAVFSPGLAPRGFSLAPLRGENVGERFATEGR
jgi:hypothetical protein